MRKLRLPGRIGAATIIALLLSLSMIHWASSAHASGPPSVVDSATVYTTTPPSNSFTNVTDLTSVTAGNELLVMVSWAGGNDWDVQSVSDAYSETFSVLAAKQCDGILDCAEIFGVTLGNTDSAMQWTVAFNQNGCPCGSHFLQTSVTIVEVSNQDGLQDGGAGAYSVFIDNGEAGPPDAHELHVVPTTTDLPSGSNDAYFGLYVDGGANAGLFLISGESRLGSKADMTVNMEHDQAVGPGTADLEFDSNPGAFYAVSLAIAIHGA